MNTKLFALIGTTAALVISTAWLASTTEAKPVATSSDRSMLLAEGGRATLNLTPEQKAQMQQIRESTRAQIEGILTQEQKNQLNAAREQMRARRQQGGQAGQAGQPGQPRQRGQRGQMWSSLNLTPEQNAQMQRIREESKQRMEAILTPEQRQQMQQMRQNRQSRRQSQ